jgi:N6-L-threonylcarbamoyladenine synthase
MKILAIETSCDETAVALLECNGDPKEDSLSFSVLGNALHSQISDHVSFGGVVPMLAKREHAKNLIPLFAQVLQSAFPSRQHPSEKTSTASLDQFFLKDAVASEALSNIFGRETEFKNEFIKRIEGMPKPDIDAIAVTEGPGLEPALWMGIIFAKALAYVFDIPLIPTNHMEGHILSVLPQKITFPALALLISGGHTELVLMPDWREYEVIGQTRDDAVGEAFDKVARMLDLPYPGGPQISRLAELQRTTQTSTPEYILPRPMIHSKDYDFSFSGIKTAVLYSLKKMTESSSQKNGTEEAPNTEHALIHASTEMKVDEETKKIISKEFEDAVTEVLVSKTFRAVEEYGIKTLIIGGGVISNQYIRTEFAKRAETYGDISLLLPDPELRTDNALMIGLAGYIKWLQGGEHAAPKATGNLSF